MKLTKYILSRCLFVGLFLNLNFAFFAQEASNGKEVVKENLTTFRTANSANLYREEWKKLNLPAFYQHPEFGKLPSNAPCEACVEILDRRTGDYRYFIDAKDNQKFYIQKSLGDINYLENNYWVAKEFALQPITNTIFESIKSEQKVGIDVQSKRTYIETSAGKIYFNQWKLIGLNGMNETVISNANWNDFTIGENGIEVINIFPNINAKMIVKNGSVKTNFIINQNNFNQFDKLIFRDAMNANAPLNFNFKHSTDLIAPGEMDVKVGGVNLLEIAEGIAYVENDGSDQSITLNYSHLDNNFDVIVPMDWININISKGALVVDPLVTGTATLAQAAVTGSQFNASCNFDNSCDYPLTIPTPAQSTFTDVTFLFDYRTKNTCRLNDGAMKVSIGSCVSPSGAGFFWLCNSPLAGTCGGGYTSIYTDVSSCLPAPLCVSQNVVMTLKFYRRCKGSAGCSNDCISADSPFIGVIEGKTLEFVNAAAPITLATTVCQNQALTASTVATAGVGPFTYNWSFNVSGTPSLGASISQSITFPTAGSQTVYLRVTDACGNIVSSSKVVNVTASPTATATSNSPICVGSPLNLTGAAAPTATSYAWTGPGGYTSNIQNPTIASATLANAGTYSLIVTNGGCPSPPATTVVVVNPRPIAAPTSNSPVCLGGTLNLSGNTLAGTTTYSWTGPGGFTSTSQNPIITPMTAGTAGTYTLTVTNGGCTSLPVNVTVAVGPSPTATPSSNSPLCIGGTLNLTSNTIAGATYAWTGPNGFTSTSQNPIITPMTGAAVGTYSLTITNSGCASTPATTAVALSASPIATAGSNSPVCVGSALNLTSNLVAGATYAWTGPNGFTSTLQNPSIPSVTAAAAGTYSLTIDNGGCVSTPSTTTVIINPVPTATAGSNSPVCVGSALNLTSNLVAGATYAWTGPNGFTSAVQNPTINAVTAAGAGTYSLTITNGGCSSIVGTTTVVITASLTATPSSNSPLCIGGTLNLTANTIAGATYAWTGPNGFTSTSQNPSINPMTAAAVGTYSLTITSGTCSSTVATTTVAISPTPTATAGSNSPVCVGSALNLTANTIAGATYAWTGPSGFISSVQNPSNPTATSVDAGTYSLIITNAGCSSTPSTTTVVINPVPTATPTYNVGICAGGTLNLTSNLVAGATYAWTGPNGFTSAVQNPTITSATAAAAGTYSLTITSAGCASTVGTVNVVISPPPAAAASYNVGLCAGGTLNLTANLVAGATYTWTGPNGFTSAVQNPTIPSVTAAAAGTYNLTITASGCTPATANVTVVVNPGPTATATSNSPICSGSTLNLSANTVTNATYGWTGPNGFTSAVQNPTIPSATSAASGSYILTVTTPGCSPVTSIVNVTVTANPTATAGSNSPICLGSTINLTAVTVAGSTYAWTGPNSFTSTLQNPSIPSSTALNSGTYSLTVTVGTCQSLVSTTSVSFSPSPIVNVTKTDVLCNGGATGTATATPTVAGTYTYAWSPSGGNGQVANNLSPGVYTVITTNSSTCTASSTITINQPTVIGLTMTSTQTACGANSGTATVLASGGTGTYTYLWSPSGGTNATASNLAAGNYSVTVTDANGCAKVGNVVVGSANPPVITVGNVTNVSCFGLTNGSATITVNGGSPGYTYNWLPSGGNAATASNLSGGQYTVTVTDNVGCTATQTITVSSPSELAITTTGNGANCGSKNGTATANVVGGSGVYTYLWTPGNLTSQSITNLTSGTYNVVVTDGNGCNVANSYTVTQIGGLNIQVNPVTALIYEGESVNLNATINPYVPGIIYEWSPPSGLTCVDCPNPTATPNSSTVYTIKITTPDGCSDSVTSTITTRINCGEYFIPTIFSPNGDGKNDIFKIYGKCIVAVNLNIFNRWGEKVFESLDQEFGWDGTYKGEVVSTDSYYYSAKISFQDGTFTTEKGSINVVK